MLDDPAATGEAKRHLFGIEVRSEFPMPSGMLSERESTGSLDIRRGETVGPDRGSLPPGRPIARYVAAGQPRYSVTETCEGYTFRVHGIGDFRFTSELAEVTVDLLPGVDDELVAVLISGTMMAFVLTMSNVLVLHGSAVQVREKAVGIVGASGMGKSTLAAWLCSAGASLVTDDVLPVDMEKDGPPTTRRGALEVRLRAKAQELAAGAGRQTADGRTAYRPAPAIDPTPLVSAIVSPRPDRNLRQVEVETLSGASALLELVSFPRLLGVSDKALLEQHFELASEAAARVPVYRVRVPWGPPFGLDVPNALFRDVGLL